MSPWREPGDDSPKRKPEPPVTIEGGEVMIEAGSRKVIESGVLAQLNRSEIESMIAFARSNPRSLTSFRDEVMNAVTQDTETAADCIYAIPRGTELNPVTKRREKKIVSGPTARFAEIVAYAWTNNRYGARVVEIGEKSVTAQGAFFDLERNVSVSIEVQHPILDSNGNRYSNDMVNMTCNAVMSVASRNAVLKAVPKAFWKGMLVAAQQTITGTRKTLHARRVELVGQFKAFNMDEPMVYRILGVDGIADITLEHLAVLNGMLTALREGDATVEGLLAEATPVDDSKRKKEWEITEAQRKLQEQRDAARKGKTPTKLADVTPTEPVQEKLGEEMKDW